MNQRQIKEKAKIWIKNLVDELEQSSIQDLLSLKLEIKIEDSSEDQDISPKSKSSSLYSDSINKFKTFSSFKREKIYKKSNTRAENLIGKHPKDLSRIRNYLKIPKSSFQRLIKEWNELATGETKTSGKYPDNDYIDKLEQTYISKLLQPPTYSMSVPNI